MSKNTQPAIEAAKEAPPAAEDVLKKEIEAILDNHARKFLDTPYENERWEITRNTAPSLLALLRTDKEPV